MSMQPDLPSRSSSNGSPDRRGEREGISNKAQLIMSHPENTPNTSFNGEAGSLERPSHDRLEYLTSKIEHLVCVHLKNGGFDGGILHAVDIEKDEIIIKVPDTFKEVMSKGRSKTEIFTADDIEQVEDLGLYVSRDGMLNAVQSEKSYHVDLGTELKLGVRDEDVPRGPSSENAFDDRWNRFMVNELIGLTSTFDGLDLREERSLQFNENEDELLSHTSHLSGESGESMKDPNEIDQISRKATNVDNDCPIDIPTYSYGPHSFYMNGLPEPSRGDVVGLAGENGTGKTTALRMLAGYFQPNLGQLKNPPWQDILTHFSRLSAIRSFLTQIQRNNLKVVMKQQNIEDLRKSNEGSVGNQLEKINERGDRMMQICGDLDLTDDVLKLHPVSLTDGELQRFAILKTVLQDADVYIFDEVSTFLNAKQQYRAAELIRSAVRPNRYIFVAEHDLCLLDYMADRICLVCGTPGIYGEVHLPHTMSDHLWAVIPRKHFKAPQETDGEVTSYTYPNMSKTDGDFKLEVMGGEFTDSQIIVMLGENGTGKPFIRMLESGMPEFEVSYKLEIDELKYEGTVRQLMIDANIDDAQFVSEVVGELKIENLYGKAVSELSVGEKERVVITLCLGKPANIYLIDELSTHLDSEQRIEASKSIKKFILHAHKTAFIVLHDLMMVNYLADRVIVVEPSIKKCIKAHPPQSVLDGMSFFLSHMNMTCRQDAPNLWPRLNRLESTKDKEQKAACLYHYLDTEEKAPGLYLTEEEKLRTFYFFMS